MDKKNTNQIKPAFNKNEVAVVFSVTDNYVPVFGTCLQSLINNSSAKNNYDIFVLTENISQNNQKRLLNICPQNFSLRFVNVTPFLSDYNKADFYLSEHITIAAYYRFFIPELFGSFSQVIYSDSDLIFLGDVAELYKIDLRGHVIGAALSGWPFAMNNQFKKYAMEKLKMADPYLYIQDGVLLCNIAKMKKINFTQGCIQRLQEIKTPRTWDQCVINSLCYGDIHFLDRKWNMEWHYPFCHPQYEEKVAKGIYDEYIKARNNPKIIHYASATKPWDAPERELAFYFWKYARISPFYEELLQSLIYSRQPQNNIIDILRDALNKNTLKWRYIKYKLLCKLSWGDKKKYYQNKKQQNKAKLQQVKEFFKEI